MPYQKPRKQKLITDAQREFVRDNYKTMSDKEIGKNIGLSEGSAKGLRNSLGFKR